jgi:hypothetical protein
MGAMAVFLGAIGCGNECERGDLDVMMTSSRGGNLTTGGRMTILRDGNVILVDQGSVVAGLSLHDVPPELLPDGAELYIVLTVEERHGHTSEQVAVFDLENGAKGPLRGAIWSTLSEPEVEGVTFSAKPKDCGSEDRCGEQHDTEMSVKIGDGPTLRAASGYRDRKGNVELGNGWSFMHDSSCGGELTEIHYGYLFIRN